MKRGLNFLVLVLFVLLLIALSHSIFHFYVFGTGISGFFERGVSGFSIGRFSVGEEQTGSFSIGASISQVVVIAEWLVILFLFLFVNLKNRVDYQKETRDLMQEEKQTPKTATDLDRLYYLLKEKKRIRFSVIQKVFGVSEQVVRDWADTLQNGNLAVVDYPRIGGPELVLLEKEARNEKGEKA